MDKTSTDCEPASTTCRHCRGTTVDAALDAPVAAGDLIDIHRIPHRVVALVGRRVLALNLTTDRTFLVQETDGSIQLPRIDTLAAMIAAGHVRPARRPRAFSKTKRMAAQIDMLEAANVPMGDKAIWIHLTAHWTPAHEAMFGPHDEPWKIRRWRTALHRSRAQTDGEGLEPGPESTGRGSKEHTR